VKQFLFSIGLLALVAAPTQAPSVHLFYGQAEAEALSGRALFLRTFDEATQEDFESAVAGITLAGGEWVSTPTNRYWQGNRLSLAFPTPVFAVGFDGLQVGATDRNLLLFLGFVTGDVRQFSINVDADTTTDLFWGVKSATPISSITFDQGDYAFGLDNVVWQSVPHPVPEPTSIPEPSGLAGLTSIGAALALLYAKPQ
jgi:hypothetical protein